MFRPTVVHLIDDVTAGGVTRVIDHILTDEELERSGRHSLRHVGRGELLVRPIRADIIVSHLTITWRALPALIALRAANPKARLVHVEHSYTGAFTELCVTRKTRFLTLLRSAFALFDRIVAVSEGQARWLLDASLTPPDSLSVIRSSVNLDAFRALPRPTGPVTSIGAIGRLERQKGFDILIQAFRRFRARGARLHVHGDGSEREALRRLADGDERIVFHGHSPDPVKVMAGLDAVAMPSRWEAYGLVALEAMTAGRPVLAAHVDGLADHVAAGATPVAEPTVEAWLAGLETLADGDFARPRAPVARFTHEWNALIARLAPNFDGTRLPDLAVEPNGSVDRAGPGDLGLAPGLIADAQPRIRYFQT